MKETAALGVDIGGTNVRLGVMSPDGRLLRAERWPMGPRRAVREFAAELHGYIDQVLAGSGDITLTGMGIGVKGYVDYARQVLAGSSIVNTDETYDLCGELSRRYGLPVVIDNDVNAATAAEIRFGAGRRHKNFVYFNIGTGAAVGIVTEGRLMRGADNDAGEMGRCRVGDVGGPFRVFEVTVSGKGLDRDARRLAPEYPDSVLAGLLGDEQPIHAERIYEACRAGDRLARALVDDMTRLLALTLLNMEFLLNARLYVFGGGAVGGEWFMDTLRGAIDEFCEQNNIRMRRPEVRLSELGAGDVGLLGAACIALDL